MEQDRVISQGIKTTLPPAADDDEPAVAAAAAPPVPPPGADAVRFYDDNDCAILGLPAPSSSYAGGGDEEAADSVLLDEYDEVGGEAYGMTDDDDGGSSYSDDTGSDTYIDAVTDSDTDSDSEFEEIDDNRRVRFWYGDAAGSKTDDLVAGPLNFLGRLTRFASFQGAAGFMRLSTTAAADGEQRGGAVIAVHYRLTRFSRPRSNGRPGVEVREFGTTLHHVRYLVPGHTAAADDDGDGAASSSSLLLRLVGAALAADVYPYGHYVQLQALWSGLVAIMPVRVPAWAAARDVVVTVDVGVLRRRADEDRTPERMESVRAALEAVARENDALGPVACGLEQHLPAPVPAVCCGGDGEENDDEEEEGGGDRRPAKRMKRFEDVVGDGEVCAICHETMEDGLAAWPRCDHVFHGKCLEQLLVTVRHRCPLCRSTLSVKGMFG